MKREDCYIQEVDYIDGDALSYNGVFVRFKEEEVFRINNGYGEFFGDSDLVEEKVKNEYADRPLLTGRTWFNYISDLAEFIELYKDDPIE